MRFSAPILVVIGISFANAFSLQTPSSIARTTPATTTTTTQLDAEKKRVVVTGLGVISGCGIGHETFFQNVVDGKSSLRTVTRFDPTNYPCQIGSEVPDEMFDPNDHFANPKNAKSNDRFTHFAVAAARLALKDAKLGDTPETLANPEKCGVFVGSAFGGVETFEKEVLKLHQKPERPKVSAAISLEYMYNLRFMDESACVR
jgi:3-oxoacyl-[acyl-carrier-protein] synthase II